MILGISIISSYFPPGKSKNRAFSILGAGQPLGYFFGMIIGAYPHNGKHSIALNSDPLSGGFLAQSKASWRAIFWLQAGLGCGLCVMGWFVLPPDQEGKRYTKGLDWFGAFLSTSGLGLLVYDLGCILFLFLTTSIAELFYRQSTNAPKGWATPFVPSLLGTSLILIICFVLWELHRESKGQSVLVPMSMWTQPRARMGPMMLLVLFAWWGFNCQGYFFPLFFQEVLQLSPIQTAVRLIPGGVSVREGCISKAITLEINFATQGVIANIIAGYLVAVIPGQVIVVLGVIACMVRTPTCAWSSHAGLMILRYIFRPRALSSLLSKCTHPIGPCHSS